MGDRKRRAGARWIVRELLKERLWLSIGSVGGLVLALTTALYPLALELLTARLVGAPESVRPRWFEWGAALGVAPADVRSFFSGSGFLWAFAGLVIGKGSGHAVHIFAWGLVTQRVIRRVRGRMFERLLARARPRIRSRRSATSWGDSPETSMT